MQLHLHSCRTQAWILGLITCFLVASASATAAPKPKFHLIALAEAGGQHQAFVATSEDLAQ